MHVPPLLEKGFAGLKKRPAWFLSAALYRRYPKETCCSAAAVALTKETTFVNAISLCRFTLCYSTAASHSYAALNCRARKLSPNGAVLPTILATFCLMATEASM